MGGSAGSGTGRTAGAFGVPPITGTAYAEALTAAVGIAISTPATASVPMLLRTRGDIAQVIDDSVRRVPQLRRHCQLIDLLARPGRYALKVNCERWERGGTVLRSIDFHGLASAPGRPAAWPRLALSGEGASDGLDSDENGNTEPPDDAARLAE